MRTAARLLLLYTRHVHGTGSASSSASAPRFDAPAGEIVGWRDRGVLRATGIPYARAQRFRAPTPQPPSATPIQATDWAPACPQNTIPELEGVLGKSSDPFPTDEDCLALSVVTPEVPAPAPRPVMVWIHGGSYVSGAGDLQIFDTRPLALEQDVVVVSVTYRLGLFGFLGGYRGRPANLGLLDLIAALRWVNENIAAFGGDLENITLFGQSAGGDAIAHLMIADGVEGLFDRAIIQSAPLDLARGRAQMHEQMGQKAASVDEDAPVEAVLRAQEKVKRVSLRYGLKAGMPFGPQYGHPPLPKEKDADAAWKRAASAYDLFIGWTAEEAALFLALSPARMLQRVPVVGGRLFDAVAGAVTKRLYSRPAVRFARRHARAGGRAYTYVLHWNEGRRPFGAAHTADLPLLFGDPGAWRKARLTDRASDGELARQGPQMRALWAGFARNGQLPAPDGCLGSGLLTWQRP